MRVVKGHQLVHEARHHPVCLSAHHLSGRAVSPVAAYLVLEADPLPLHLEDVHPQVLVTDIAVGDAEAHGYVRDVLAWVLGQFLAEFVVVYSVHILFRRVLHALLEAAGR